MNARDYSSHPLERPVRCEERDIRSRPLLVGMAAIIVLLVLVAGAMAALLRGLAGKAGRRPPASTTVPDAVAHELQQLRQREDERLGSYGWVSRGEAIVRIPLERAMELAIEEATANDE
jgi:hypothetical protein